ncbi:MAG: tagatose 1,6-diphosphate aldolase [Chloroflexota bacterium]
MVKQISIGKFRALQRASHEGVFGVLAIDHLDSLRRAINPDEPRSVPDETMEIIKHQVVFALREHITGTLLDPVYGAAQAVGGGLSKSIGLLVELEKADYNMQPLPQVVEIRPNWSVEKIKRMSADGVKLFYYYDPDDEALCARQDSTIQQVVEKCRQYDIPLYAEPIVINTDGDDKQQKVIQTAKRADELGADILKLEFPADSANVLQWQPACEALTRSLSRPWVLLSAGVTFDTFTQQVEIACKAGACGFIVGRAVWGEACKISNHDERFTWLQSVGVERIRHLANIARRHASNWHSYYEPTPITTTWHIDYQDDRL